MKEGNLVVISGPSGAGKGSISSRILKEMDNIEFSTSMTTRKPRSGEEDGKDYYFVTREEFQDAIAKGDFIEYAEVFGNYYGTPKKEVESRLKEGKNILLDIDVQGALNVMKSFPEGLFIFVLPPSLEELRHRIVHRGKDEPDVIERRLGQAESEIAQADKYDYQIVNDDLDDAVEKIKKIIITGDKNGNNKGGEAL